MSGEETDRQAAAFKAFLMKSSSKTNKNLYDHLTEVLVKIMDEQPDDAVDVFEDISQSVKKRHDVDNQSTLRDVRGETPKEQLAQIQKPLFICPEESQLDEELLEPAVQNLPEVSFYLEQMGVGPGRMELQKIFLAMKQLVNSHALVRCRYWGKILGRQSNYIIVEADYREGEEEEEEHMMAESFGEREEEGEENTEANSLPKSTYRPPPVVPMEAPGTGANKFVYYVCNEPGFPWSKLPAVTPAQIVVARQIRKLFTGRLDAPIHSYPPFPGNEANYLRAQIARISAGTQVSPMGFYQFKEEEENDDETVAPDTCEINSEFEGVLAVKLVEELSNWVHHTQYIFTQGRCTWVNVSRKMEELAGEGEEEGGEGEEEPEEVEHEAGPPLLTPLSQDMEYLNSPPWTLRNSSRLTPEHGVAFVCSNLWPGAYAYASGKKCETVYIGWGMKYVGDGYSPPVPPPPQSEYPEGPVITEALDPSVEEEQEMEDAQDEQEEEREAQEETDEEEEDD